MMNRITRGQIAMQLNRVANQLRFCVAKLLCNLFFPASCDVWHYGIIHNGLDYDNRANVLQLHKYYVTVKLSIITNIITVIPIQGK